MIDEIQQAPALLSVVHSLIEQNKSLQFILTGLSARKLRRTNANLLGGPALMRTLDPFMAAEVESKFSLADALQNGMLPLVFGQEDPQQTLQAYITLYLEEEIHAEGLVRNIENFARFLEAITFYFICLIAEFFMHFVPKVL